MKSSFSLFVFLIIIFFSFIVLSTLWLHYHNHNHYSGDSSISCSYSSKQIQLLRWSPRVLLYRNFISIEEANYLIDLGEPKLKPSTVTSRDGNSLSNHRTSNGAFISTNGDPILLSIEQRIAEWTMIPVEHGEKLYILRYKEGEEYVPHYDYFTGPGKDIHIGNAGQRAKTVIIYLHSPIEGGNTSFPLKDISIQPNIGDAILFYNMHVNGTTDSNTLHAGEPVIKGEKWIITKWIREKPYSNNWYAEQQRKYAERYKNIK